MCKARNQSTTQFWRGRGRLRRPQIRAKEVDQRNSSKEHSNSNCRNIGALRRRFLLSRRRIRHGGSSQQKIAIANSSHVAQRPLASFLSFFVCFFVSFDFTERIPPREQQLQQKDEDGAHNTHNTQLERSSSGRQPNRFMRALPA
jgi:hypothetical protein